MLVGDGRFVREEVVAGRALPQAPRRRARLRAVGLEADGRARLARRPVSRDRWAASAAASSTSRSCSSSSARRWCPSRTSRRSCSPGPRSATRRTEAQHERWLAPMIAGETTLALAWAERAAATTRRTSRHARDQGGQRATGSTARRCFVAERPRRRSRSWSRRRATAVSRSSSSTATASGVTGQAGRTIDGRGARWCALDGVAVDADRLLGDATRGRVRARARARLRRGRGRAPRASASCSRHARHDASTISSSASSSACQSAASRRSSTARSTCSSSSELCHAMNVLACVSADDPDAAVAQARRSAPRRCSSRRAAVRRAAGDPAPRRHRHHRRARRRPVLQAHARARRPLRRRGAPHEALHVGPVVRLNRLGRPPRPAAPAPRQRIAWAAAKSRAKPSVARGAAEPRNEYPSHGPVMSSSSSERNAASPCATPTHSESAARRPVIRTSDPCPST